jgi:hypothetical protein
MNRTHVGVIGGLVVVTACAGVFASRKQSEARHAAAAHTAIMQREADAAATATKLETRLRELGSKAETIEADNAALRAALTDAETARGVALTKAVPLSRDALTARFRAARDLARAGEPTIALQELIWCLDEGLNQSDSVARSSLQSQTMAGFRALAERYPPARQELQTRRDALRHRILANEGGRDFVAEYADIVKVLNQESALLSLIDEFPAGDRRRTVAAIYASELLLREKRYAESMEGKTAGSILGRFEMDARLPGMTTASRDGGPNFLATTTAKDIERLAGSGDLASARELARRLLVVDGSEATRALIQKHLERAGQPTLLSTSGP